MTKPAKVQAFPAPLPKKNLDPVNWINQPARVCGNCEHFHPSKIAKGLGSCHNLISGRWNPRGADAGCQRGWYPDVKRFPLEVRYHAKG